MSFDNIKKFQKLIKSDPNLKKEVELATKDAKSRDESIDATLPIAKRVGFPFTKNDVKKLLTIDDEQLDEVAGGAWGFHTYHSQAIYNDCGIETDWTGWYNPFQFDKFKWKSHPELVNFDKNDAAAVVFYTHAHGREPKNLREAYDFKSKNIDLFKKDVENCNSRG